MTTLLWIVAAGLAMNAIALVGCVTFVLSESAQRRLLLPLVSLAAGTLLGGAMFHMIPAALEKLGNDIATQVWTLAGFSLFLALEQFLHWHHGHGPGHPGTLRGGGPDPGSQARDESRTRGGALRLVPPGAGHPSRAPPRSAARALTRLLDCLVRSGGP